MTGPIDHGRLHYRRAGTGPALVLVHGFLGGSSTWHGQIRRFGPTRDVIAPDLAGFGASRMAMAPDSIEGHARLVIDLVDSLGVEAFELLGHSMGGMVAQKIALMNEEIVSPIEICARDQPNACCSGSMNGPIE